MLTLLWICIFIASILILIKSSDFFTDSAEKIGVFFGLPAFVIGVTIVATGTSLPELISSIIAVLQGSTEIVSGNVIGANVTNIFLILGLAAIIGKNIKIKFELIHVDLPLLMASSLLLALIAWDGAITIPEGILCVLGLGIYLFYASKGQTRMKVKEEIKAKESRKKKIVLWKPLIALIISGFFIYLGARFTVMSVVQLSELFGIGKGIIAATAMSFGTTLPELMVTLSATLKKKPEMALGNVLGSNVFNALGVIGIPALMGGLIVPGEIRLFALPVMVIGTLLFFFMTQDKEITSWEGFFLLLFYVFYIGKLFAVF